MPVIRIESFRGMAPIADPRKLPDANATYALQTRLDGGDVRAFRAPAVTGSAPNVTAVDRLYRFTASDGSRRWLAWNSAGARVDPVPSPVPRDENGRLYWSTKGGQPAYAKNPTAVGQPLLVNGVRHLGIPQPTQAPVAAGDSEGDGIAWSLTPTAITNAAPAIVSFAGDHPFKEGQRVRIVTTPVSDDEANMSEISGKEFIVAPPSDDSIGFARNIELRGSNTTNFSELTDPSRATVSRAFTEADYESRSYVYTLVSDCGEEGPPSPPSAVFDAFLEGVTEVSVSPGAQANFQHLNRVRLYRTLSGTQGAKFYYVDEFPYAPLSGAVTYPNGQGYYADKKKEIELGEPLPSEQWIAPPGSKAYPSLEGQALARAIYGLTPMPNGFMVAFNGNTIYACEAYQPHAWPDAYRKTVDYTIIGAAPLGQSAVVATEGRPYMLTGSDPASLTASVIELDAPCISAAGIVNVGFGVAYPTYEGLAIVSQDSARIVTQSIMSKWQWLDLWAAGLEGAFKDGTYFAFSPFTTRKSFALRIERDVIDLVMLDSIVAKAPAIDTTDDSLFFVTKDGASRFNQLTKWEGGGTLLPYSWTSKVFTQARPISLACAQVFASTYPVTLTIASMQPGHGGETGALTTLGTFTVNNSTPFRLPGGFTAREWQVTVSGTSGVQSVHMATSMGELRGE